jgi:hypothetical protein
MNRDLDYEEWLDEMAYIDYITQVEYEDTYNYFIQVADSNPRDKKVQEAIEWLKKQEVRR